MGWLDDTPCVWTDKELTGLRVPRYMVELVPGVGGGCETTNTHPVGALGSPCLTTTSSQSKNHERMDSPSTSSNT